MASWSGVRIAGSPSGRAGHRPAAVHLLLTLAGVVLVATTAITAIGHGRPSVVLRAPDGEVLARVPLPGDRFAVGYRNSMYTTLAEQRYRVLPDGRFQLVQIAAEQSAVLEEYYALPSAPAPPGDRLAYVAEPDPLRPAVFKQLDIAATDLGERTLYVPGSDPVPMWRIRTGEDPTVLLAIEQ